MIGIRHAVPAFAWLLLAVSAQAQETAGFAEWVRPSAWGTPPAAAARQELAPGREVVRDERVETAPRGASDLLFLLGSRLLVGPECEITLDQSYYDPELEEIAEVGLYSDTVCVVRADAGGEALVLGTPIATVTIDRTSATVVYAPLGANIDGITGEVGMAVVAGAGPAGAGGILVQDGAGGPPSFLVRPGFATFVGPDGTTTSAPASAETMAWIQARFEGPGGGATAGSWPEVAMPLLESEFVLHFDDLPPGLCELSDRCDVARLPGRETAVREPMSGEMEPPVILRTPRSMPRIAKHRKHGYD